MATSAKKTANLLTDRELEIVREAARAAFVAGLTHATERSKTAFEDTEKRLRNLPVLKAKVEDDHEKILELQANGSPLRSASLVRFKRSGSRVKPEDALDALLQDMTAHIAANEHEIRTVEKALSIIEGDQYAKIIPCMYFVGMGAEDTAEELFCDRSTIFRARARLVNRIAVYLYGVDAT